MPIIWVANNRSDSLLVTGLVFKMTSAIRLWDFESELHYEDFTFSGIMETEDKDTEDHDVQAFVPQSEEN